MLYSDSGTKFNNRTVNELAVEFGIHRFFISLYYPQANPVETTNRVIKTMIRSFIDQDNRYWYLHLNEFRFALRTLTKGETKLLTPDLQV